ncbi:MAG: hypothetical protein GQ557_00370 [Mycoplasmataceae bacterium]|nr:hypothetical protein [Mycoplasmataceae bacterium]
MEQAWVVALVILVAYPPIEIVVGFFFNYKIYMIAKEKFSLAAIMGATSTFLFVIIMSITPLISASVDAWWIIFVAAFATGIGNLIAALLVPIAAKRFGHIENITEDSDSIISQDMWQKYIDEENK